MRSSRALLLDLFIILLVTAASSAIAYHNVLFASPFDSPDIRAHQQNAVEWIRNGVIPFRGQGTSYSGWGTPGTTYLMLPGVLLFSDWRLQEIPGAVLLHAGTLLFLYFILRRILGRVAALAAVCIAGFSPLTGPTLWPNGHPFFVVGMLYFLIRWAKDRQGWAFAAALLLLAAGLYVYPTIAPAAFAIPIVWLIYRPPFAWKPLAAAVILGTVLWAPFLYYEAGQNFSDVVSMVTRKDVSSGDGSLPVYCFAAQIGEPDQIGNIYVPYLAESDPQRIAYPGGGRLQSAAYHACVFLMHFDENFDAGWFLLAKSEVANRVLFGLFLAGVAVLSGAAWPGPWSRWSFWKAAVPMALGGALVLWLVIQPEALAGLIVWDGGARQNMRLVLEQARIFLPLAWCALAVGLVAGSKSGIERCAAGVLVVCLLCSCLLLAGIAEPDRPWRFWWLWPLHTIGLVAGVFGLSKAAFSKTLVQQTALFGVLILAFPLTSVQSAAVDVARNGFGGRDSGQWQVLAYLAEAARTRQTQSLSISVTRYQADGDTTRPGGWLDFGLHYSYGIDNLNSDGPATADAYRLEDFRQGVPPDLQPLCPWEGWNAVFQSARLVLCAPGDGK